MHVVTDVLDLEIGLTGGELRQADLLAYPLVKGQSKPVRLFNRDGAHGFYVLQTGLTGGANGAPHPTHLATFTSAAKEYRLAAGQKELRVPLTWTDGHGVTVTKTYVFERGRYNIGLDYDVQNKSASPWSAASYAQILRDNIPVERSMFSPDSYAFKGPAIYDGTKYRKLKLDKAEDTSLSLDVTGGWIAGMQHHFVTAVVPPLSPAHIAEADGNKHLLSTVGRTPGHRAAGARRFSGNAVRRAEAAGQLETTGPELERVADTACSAAREALFILLKWLHRLVAAGRAIVLATCILSHLLSAVGEGGKSMAKMKTITPRIRACGSHGTIARNLAAR